MKNQNLEADLQKLFSPVPGVRVLKFIHADHCQKPNGGTCTCNPVRQLVTAEEWLEAERQRIEMEAAKVERLNRPKQARPQRAARRRR